MMDALLDPKVLPAVTGFLGALVGAVTVLAREIVAHRLDRKARTESVARAIRAEIKVFLDYVDDGAIDRFLRAMEQAAKEGEFEALASMTKSYEMEIYKSLIAELVHLHGPQAEAVVRFHTVLGGFEEKKDRGLNLAVREGNSAIALEVAEQARRDYSIAAELARKAYEQLKRT